MNTKIVYAVTSDDYDIYLDQLVFSVQTLKFHNPNAHICIVMDNITNLGICGGRNKIVSLVDNIVIIETPENIDKKLRSRFIKTQVRQHIVGDYLFIDTDTIITDDLSQIDYLNYDVAACLDRHLPLSQNQMRNSILSQMKAVGLHPDNKDELYFNSGVMFVKDTPLAHKLYELWHFNWFKSQLNGINIDQPALALSNKELGYIIKELPHIWNCQILGNGLKYVGEAKIVHYYNANTRTRIKNCPYLLTRKDVFLKFRENHYEQKEFVEQAATFPCSLFSEKNDILSGDILDVYYTDASRMLYYICGFHTRLFSFINGVSRVVFSLFAK